MGTVQSYKCPSCGAPLSFDASGQNLHCQSCGNKFSAETLQQLDEAYANTEAQSKYDWEHYEPRSYDGTDGESLASYVCPSCGAEITGDENLGATVCPYCGNANIVKGKFEGTLKPDYIIPFKIDKKSAMQCFENACKNAPFLPDEFKNKRKIEEMSGIYIPFWNFDCDCDACVTYNAQRITSWSDAKYDYIKTDYFKLFREGSIGFEHIPVDGSKKTDNTYTEALEPYNYADAINFSTAYLSGFLADKYDVSADECIDRANERVENSTKAAFAQTAAMYDRVVPENTRVSFSNGKIRYALLPVWMLNIKYNDKMYKYAINGQTGKVVGDYPICKKKRNIYFAKVFGITLVIAAVGAWIYLNWM